MALKPKLQIQSQNVPFYPIAASGSNFNPRNTHCIPVANPDYIGTPSLILNPDGIGKHFETASADGFFQLTRRPAFQENKG
jgi:hypothetical protein